VPGKKKVNSRPNDRTVNMAPVPSFKQFIKNDKAVEAVLASLMNTSLQSDLDNAIYAPVLTVIPGQLDQVHLALLDSGNVTQREAMSYDLHKRLNQELHATQIKARAATSTPLAIMGLSEPFTIRFPASIRHMSLGQS
jgi:hypothetical protein